MDFLIKEAVQKELEEEFNSIPPIEELTKMYEFSERHVQKMQEIFADLRRRERFEGYIYTIRKVAVIALAILAFALISVKFVPEVYAYVKAWIMETKEDRIEFRGRSISGSAEAGESLRFELGYIPEGYEPESEYYSQVGSSKITYRHYDGKVLSLQYCDESAGGLMSVNTEGVLVEVICVDGIQYHSFASNDGRCILVWENGEYLLALYGSLDRTQLLEIAASVKVTENGMND